ERSKGAARRISVNWENLHPSPSTSFETASKRAISGHLEAPDAIRLTRDYGHLNTSIYRRTWALLVQLLASRLLASQPLHRRETHRQPAHRCACASASAASLLLRFTFSLTSWARS